MTSQFRGPWPLDGSPPVDRASSAAGPCDAEALLTHFAVLEGVAGRGARTEVVGSLLRQTNLWEVRRAKLGTYSGGMRQRFGVAIALLGDPRLLILVDRLPRRARGGVHRRTRGHT